MKTNKKNDGKTSTESIGVTDMQLNTKEDAYEFLKALGMKANQTYFFIDEKGLFKKVCFVQILVDNYHPNEYNIFVDEKSFSPNGMSYFNVISFAQYLQKKMPELKETELPTQEYRKKINEDEFYLRRFLAGKYDRKVDWKIKEIGITEIPKM